MAGLAFGYDPSDEARAASTADVLRRVYEKAPQADTIYLHRNLVRASEDRGDGLVAQLRECGHRVDCWTIDHGASDAVAALVAAITAGCSQITTNTAFAWTAAKLEEDAGETR